MTVITQLYCQLYITCQLHVSANTILAIIRLDTIIGENYTIYNMIQYNHQCRCKSRGTISRLQKSWRARVQKV